MSDVLAEVEPLLIRNLSPGATQDVRFADRELDLLAAPYHVRSSVVSHGLRHTEEFAPTAFDGIESRPNRVKLLREHDVRNLLGRAKRFVQSKAGLVGIFRVSDNPDGDAALALAADEAFDVSVGFAPMPGGDDWSPDRTHVVRRRAWLAEVSLVTFGAYEGASVLAVRGGQVVQLPTDEAVAPATQTPLKDATRAELLRTQLERAYPVLAKQ